jgi:hypothetical protein
MSKLLRNLRPETTWKIVSRLHQHGYAELGLHAYEDAVHPWLHSDSHEARSTGGLNLGKSLTRTARGQVGQPPLTHLLTDKAFNATTSTYVATAPPAWEQYPCLILLFSAHPGMDGKKVATIHTTSKTILSPTPPRRTRRQPPRSGFLGLSIIRSSSTPSATSWPGLDRRRSTKEQRPHIDHRGSHARHRTQGLSPSHHRRHHDTPGMASIHRRTSPQQPLQRPPRLHASASTWPYKRESRGFSKQGTRSTDKAEIFSTSEINIWSKTLFFSFLETWDRLPLSQLVTPIQALQCKEIQYYLPPLDVGLSLPEPR